MTPLPDEALFDELHAAQTASWDRQRRARVPAPAERAGIALVVLGVAAALGFSALPSLAANAGAWGALAVFGAPTLGAALLAWTTHGARPPGLVNHGVQLGALHRRGLATAALTVPFVVLYLALWWSNYASRIGWVFAAAALVALWAYGRSAALRYAGTVALALLVVALWYVDHLPTAWRDTSPLAGGVALIDPISRSVFGRPADKWVLYTVLYSFGVSLMAIRMSVRYRHSRYHLARTASLVFWQLAFGMLVPFALAGGGLREHYFTYFWPLKPEYLLPFQLDGFWSAGTVGRAMFLWGVAASFVAVPLFTYWWGKRWYCSWVCGCGALAETVGDPWRHHADTSTASWRVERFTVHGVLAAIVGITAALWLHEALGRPWWSDGGSALFWDTYGLLIVAGFAGVIGTGFYPLLGARIWCRFGCPQAAILGLLQRYLSRFRITTNGGQCISCGNCSTYCEMGIDVRAYAQRGDNIVRASCVGCGVCAEVCPRGVLKLENGPMTDRFDGADEPLGELLRSLGVRPRQASSPPPPGRDLKT